MTTEKKFKSVQERLPTIEAFHQLLVCIQRTFPQVIFIHTTYCEDYERG